MRWKRLLLKQQDALLCVIDQGVVSVAGFATTVLVARYSPEELGIYFIALSIVLFMRGFQEQMIAVPYTIFHHHHPGKALASYRGSCLVQQFGLSLVILVFLAAMTAATAAGVLESSMFAPLIVLMLLMPALLMREIIRQYCFTHGANVSVLGIDLAISILQVVGLIGLGWLGWLSGTSAWAAIGVACAMSLSVWYFWSRPAVEISKSRLKQDWQQNWSFGKWATAGQLVGSLPTFVLPWLLAASAGTKDTGFFAAAISLVGIANIFNLGMANFLTPKAAQVYVDEGAHGLRRVIFRMVLIFLVAIGGFGVLLTLFGGWIAVTLMSAEYAGLQMAITVLAIGKLFEGWAIVASNGLFVMGLIRANFWVDVLLMVVTIVAAVLLVFPLGVMGTVWTAVIGACTGAVSRFAVLLVCLSREMNAEVADAA